MTLRKTTLLVLGATLLALLALVYLIARLILLASFARLEANEVQQDIGRAHDALTTRLDTLNATAGDYANWDDTYAFVANTYPAYIEANLIPPTFDNLRLNLLAVVDLKGGVVYGTAYDLEAGEFRPLPPAVQPLLAPGSRLLDHPTETSSLTGLVMLPEGPLLVAARPILTSEYTGPSRGTLILGRYLDAAEITRLAEVTHLDLTLAPFDGTAPPPAAPTVRVLDAATVAGETVLLDLNGRPALVLRVTQPRSIYQEGRRTVAFFLLALLGSGLVFGLTNWRLLERFVLRRLVQLSQAVRQIGERADASLRVELNGHDELSAVASAINGMLDALARAHQALRASEEKFRTLAETSAAAIIIAQGEQVRYANTRARVLTGHASHDLLAAPLRRLAPAGAAPQLQEVQVTPTEGAARWLEVTAGRIDYEGQPATIATAYDITDRKHAQESLQLANARLTALVGQLEQRNRESALLSEMSDLLQVCPTAEESYGVVARFLEALFSGPASGLYLYRASRDHLQLVATAGAFASGPPARTFSPDDCWALRLSRPHALAEPDAGPRCAHLPAAHAGSSLCVPVLAQGEALGVLYLQLAAPGPLADWKRLAETVGERLALALANVHLREALQHQALRDPLTGLFNRRYLHETLPRELKRAERAGHPVGLLIFDLDHFKRFNDTHGHDAGDALLREFGVLLRARLRAEDIVCRYGGEEFLLIMPEAPLAACLERANALRAEVKALSVRHYGETLGGLTVSVGVALFPAHGATGELALRAADQALYRAKHEGRDCVRVAEEM